MLRHRAILILLLAAAAALPAGARLRAALGPDGRAGRRELFRGHWERAAQAFQRAVDSGPPASGYPTPAEFEGLGYACLKARRYGDAARAYQRLCAMSSFSPHQAKDSRANRAALSPVCALKPALASQFDSRASL